MKIITNKLKEVSDEETQKFDELVQPLIEWLQVNYHSNAMIMINTSHAEVVVSEMLIPFKEVKGEELIKLESENNPILKILHSVDIIDVISKYVPLELKGARYFGNCPIHNDITFNLSISKEYQIYTCFACGSTGNVFKFLQEYKNISFLEAVKECADIVGIDFNVNTVDENISKEMEVRYEDFSKQ